MKMVKLDTNVFPLGRTELFTSPGGRLKGNFIWGSELAEVLESRGEWIRVGVDEGSGWIPATQVKPLG